MLKDDSTLDDYNPGADGLWGLADIPATKKDRLVKAGKLHKESYGRPGISEEARTTGGYICDKKDPDFNNSVLAREAAQSIHTIDLGCSLSAGFADKAYFRALNVLLEILQNSESKDSKGTWFALEFYADGQWRDLKEVAQFKDNDIQKIRICDNGYGYLPEDITVIGGGGKKQDDTTAGNHGTGMKISDRYALGFYGMQIVRYSLNWKAVPRLVRAETSGGIDATTSYNVDFFDQCYGGSVVEYSSLHPEIIAAMREVPDHYLPLDPTFEKRLITQNDAGIILKPKSGDGAITVMGRSYVLKTPFEHPMLYSYDLHLAKTDDQNRHHIDTGSVADNIQAIWAGIEDPAMFKGLLLRAQDMASTDGSNETCIELMMPGLSPAPEGFKSTATAHYEITNPNRTYVNDLATTAEDNKILEAHGYKGLDPYGSRMITETFGYMGIRTGADFLDLITKEQTIIHQDTGQYEGEVFPSAVCRAIAIIDQLECTREIVVVLADKDGKESQMPYMAFTKAKEKSLKGKKATKVLIKAKGFQFKKDQYGDLSSTQFCVRDEDAGFVEKPDGSLANSRRSWRETVHPILAACTAAGAKCLVKNGQYEFVSIEFFGYYLRLQSRKWEELPAQNLEVEISVANPSQEAELRELNKYSLNLDPDYDPVLQTPHGDIVDTKGKHLYEHGVRKRNEEDMYLMFSYNFPKKVGEAGTVEAIAAVLQEVTTPEIPTIVLKHAKSRGSMREYHEYSIFPDKLDESSANAAAWRAAFEKVFGKDAVVDDMHGLRHRSDAVAVQKSAKINLVRLDPKLEKSLGNCHVRKLSDAVQGAAVVEHAPSPIQETLLNIEHALDIIIDRELGGSRTTLSSEVKVAKSIRNCFDQEILKADSYANPFRNEAIYLNERITRTGTVDRMVSAILERKIQLYRYRMSNEEYLEFRGKVMVAAGRALMNIGFFHKVRRAIVRKRSTVATLVEVAIKRAEKPVPDDEDEHFEAVSEKIMDTLRNGRDGVMGVLSTVGEAGGASIGAVVGATQEFVSIVFSTVGRIGRVGLPILLIAGAVIGTVSGVLYGGSKVIQNKDEIFAFLGIDQAVSKRKRPAFERPSYDNDSVIGVTVEKPIGAGEFSSPRERMKHRRTAFFSTPEMFWGDFMVEQTLSVFNGVKWERDPNAPDFENPHFSEVERFAHLQMIDEDNENPVHIRNQIGGYIDRDTITFIDKGGKEVSEAGLKVFPSGSMEVSRHSSGLHAISYQTAVPVKWENTANSLTWADFEALPQGPYDHYIQVPDTDITKVNSPNPDFSNLKDFFDSLDGLSPWETIQALRDPVLKMRYLRNERTAKAFGRFNNGKTEEKEFLPFAMNSQELEQPGDGDCDVQNSLFALYLRYKGIPSRHVFIITHKGSGHGPTEVFLPKIGWVQIDTMGTRPPGTEPRARAGIAQSRRQPTQAEIQAELQRRIKAKFRFEERGCSELNGGF